MFVTTTKRTHFAVITQPTATKKQAPTSQHKPHLQAHSFNRFVCSAFGQWTDREPCEHSVPIRVPWFTFRVRHTQKLHTKLKCVVCSVLYRYTHISQIYIVQKYA